MASNQVFKIRQRLIRRTILLLPMAGLIGAAIFLRGAISPRTIDFWLFLGGYLASVAGIQVGYHRLFAHRTFHAHPIVRGVLVILGSMAGHGPIFGWVAVHRKHHEHADRVGDPHSPHIGETGLQKVCRGLWHAQVGWLWNTDLEMPDYRKVVDLIMDPVVFRLGRVNAYYISLASGVLAPALIGGVYSYSWQGAVQGFLWGGMLRIMFSLQVACAINSVSHSFGDQPFRTEDESRDNLWLALLSLGGWQNTHHAFPCSYSNQWQWWRLDPAAWAIRSLAAIGLASDLRYPNMTDITAKRHPEHTPL